MGTQFEAAWMDTLSHLRAGEAGDATPTEKASKPVSSPALNSSQQVSALERSNLQIVQFAPRPAVTIFSFEARPDL